MRRRKKVPPAHVTASSVKIVRDARSTYSEKPNEPNRSGRGFDFVIDDS